MKLLNTRQLMLLSTGGMIGCGWLFSPYYGFQIAGVGVLLSWLIVAILTLVIGLSFAEVVTSLPVVGGISRFIGITHNSSVSFVFLVLGWLSYVVYLPLEAQSAIQYLGFWFSDLVKENDSGATIFSGFGLLVSLLIMVFLTWFNSLLLSKVAKANSLVSIWKIFVPLAVAWVLVLWFGDWQNVELVNNQRGFSFEKVLLAITSGGLAFGFTGFQNGLILANSSQNPKKSLPYSLFAPILIGLLLYSSLSFLYIVCLGNKTLPAGGTAPLLGLITLFGVHILTAVLFIDAVIAPLGTANVYTAVTARVLYGLSQDFFSKGFLNKINKFNAPSHCLWFNMAVGVCFLLPFPTWQQLVDFLSSVVIFSYLAGPVVLLVLRRECPNLSRPFHLSWPTFIGYVGFVFCSLLIYWSNIRNLEYLVLVALAILIGYSCFIEKKWQNFASSLFIPAHLLMLLVVKFCHKIELVKFPFDNFLVAILSLIFCRIFIANKISTPEIEKNIARLLEKKGC